MCRHLGLFMCFTCLTLASPLEQATLLANPGAPNLNPHVQQLFDKYGTNGTLDMEAFTKLLATLGLPDPSSPKIAQCTLDSSLNANSEISTEKFVSYCPAILSQLESKKCHTVMNDSLVKDHVVPSTTNVWSSAILSVLAISICGMAAVSVIPCFPEKQFQKFIQYLVALAIGTLTGDAFLHLLPHAFMGHQEEMPSLQHLGHIDHHHESSHGEGVSHAGSHYQVTLKGLVALLVMTFFFVAERLLHIFGQRRSAKQKEQQKRHMLKVVAQSSKAVGEKLCLHHDHKHHSQNGSKDGKVISDGAAERPASRSGKQSPDSCANWEGLVVGEPLILCKSHPICAGSDFQDCADKSAAKQCSGTAKVGPEDSVPQQHLSLVPPKEDKEEDDEEYTVFIAEHHTSHYGHSHSHGHVHAKAGSFAALAWMVLVGDGFHNLTDGLAIGAAYAASLTSGFTTSIAILCHELPHELGDFAVLLKSGMTVRQALLCNLLSSALCMLGVVMGVALSSSEDATGWLFAATAGMFLYIALVDMVPELSNHIEAHESVWLRLVIHLSGLLTGFTIMLVIALYEDDIKSLFPQGEN